jgi:hypothetical protein
VIYLPAALVQSPDLPSVCSRHGRPAVATRKIAFHSRPPLWTALFLVFALLIALIVMVAIQKTIKAPAWRVCDACFADRSKRVLLGWLLLLPAPIVIGVLAANLPSTTGSAEAFAIVALIVGCVLAGFLVLSSSGWTQLFAGDVVTGGADLRLRKAHPAFVAALPPPPPLPSYGAYAPAVGFAPAYAPVAAYPPPYEPGLVYPPPVNAPQPGTYPPPG